MPDDFDPKIWWVSLGMNDLGRMQCSEEVVVIGILRVVEEILQKKPNAQVVVNSMLPMADLRGGIYPHMNDYQDAFKQYKGGNVQKSHYARAPPTNNMSSNNNNDNKHRMLMMKRNRRKQSPQVEGDDPNNPEPLKQAIKRIKRKDPYNPKLPTANMIHKYNSKQLFMKQNRLPLWTSISAINKELKRFCAKHERVTFFDATDIFAEREQANQYVLQSDKISVRGHPTVWGYEAWENAILEKIKKMLANEPEEVTKLTPKKKSNDDEIEKVEDSSESESGSK